ncbi:hypothetical protein RJ035_007705 [Blastomyces gilchristii]
MSIAIEFKADAPHFGDAGKAAASTLRSSGVHCAKVYRQDLMTNHPVVDRESSLNFTVRAAYLSLRNPVLQATSAGPKKLSGQE